MFYVCKKRDDGTFGVMDTQDGVVEYYHPHELLRIMKRFHIEVQGVTKKPDGKYRIKALEPIMFQDKPKGQLTVNSDGSTDWYSHFENCSAEEQTVLLEPLRKELLNVVFHLLGHNVYDSKRICLIDGLDCVGFENIETGIGDVKFSIYSNPDVNENGIYAEGFGIDISIDGNKGFNDEYHFDSTFKDWGTDIQNFKHKELFPIFAK